MTPIADIWLKLKTHLRNELSHLKIISEIPMVTHSFDAFVLLKTNP